MRSRVVLLSLLLILLLAPVLSRAHCDTLGGPVIQDDKVVGVAFQGLSGLENAGFFIPPPIILHFLKDIEEGKYNGFPQIGARLVDLQNPAYRNFLKLPDNNLGARVDSLLPRP